MTDVIDLQEQALRPTTPGEGWAVTDERAAEWALTKIKQARQRADDRTATARELIAAHHKAIADLHEVVAAHDAEAQRTVDHFTGLLIAWHRKQYAADPDHAKSIKLAGGTLTSRAGGESVEVIDEQEVLASALECGADFAELVPVVHKARVKAWLKKRGATVEGARLVRADRTFEVKAS